MSLIPCASCHELVTDGTSVCPHCGESKACHRTGGHAPVLLLGITLAVGSTGCWKGQALYGVTFTPTDTAGPSDTGDTGAATTSKDE